uniref:Uncharacterized protein n=1 Tax=Rhizophora mucronata TaxID=61149 RepID=A0A2P2NNL1_RHIMU
MYLIKLKLNDNFYDATNFYASTWFVIFFGRSLCNKKKISLYLNNLFSL